MSLPVGYKDILIHLATTRVRLILSELMKDKDYEEKVREENLEFPSYRQGI